MGILLESLINEANIIIPKDDYYYNFDKWENGSEILMIVGLSGSGKSTLGKKLAKQYNVKYIELDNIEVELSEIYGKDKIKNMSYDEYSKLFIDYVMNGKLKGTRRIMEGIDLILLSDYWDTINLKNYPIIIKNTSFIKSSIRAYIRDKEYNYSKFKNVKNNNIYFYKYIKKLEKYLSI